jgi:hypothetical protein
VLRVAPSPASFRQYRRVVDKAKQAKRFLREELERKDAALLNLTERIPQLEAPQEAR